MCEALAYSMMLSDGHGNLLTKLQANHIAQMGDFLNELDRTVAPELIDLSHFL